VSKEIDNPYAERYADCVVVKKGSNRNKQKSNSSDRLQKLL